MKRLYTFREPWPQVPNTSASNTAQITGGWIETQKPNPFHGLDRWVFAFDEWAHRHDLNTRGPLRWLCGWWDRRLFAAPSSDPGEGS